MGTEDELVLKVRAQADTAIKEINKLNKEVKTLTKESAKNAAALKKQKSAFDNVSKSAKGISDQLGKITLGLGAMGIAFKGIEFANLAADAEQAADAFDKVVTDMGYVAEEEFKKIKEASQGLISDKDIKQSAVTALSLGVPLEQLAGLMEVARAKAREMGIDTKQAFFDLVGGVAKGSFELLNNLGITVKVGEENKKYAASIGKTVEQLTAQDKIQAIANATLEKGASSVKRFADAGLSSKENIQKMNASIENLKVTIGEQLLPALSKLTEDATEWANSLSDADLESFGSGVDLVVTSLSGLLKVVKELNDVFAPDVLFGEGVGILDLFARGVTLFDYGLTKLISRVDNVNGAFDTLVKQKNEVSGLATAVERFTGDSITEFDALQEAISDVMDANEKQIQEWNSRQPEIYAEKIKKLSDENTKLVEIYGKLVSKRPYEEQKKSAEDAADAIEGLTENTKKYTEAEIKELAKLNKKRVKDTESALKNLEKSEAKLASDIVKINEKLIKDLEKIANDRFKMNQDIESQISELKRGALEDDAAYYDRQREAEEALSNAKLALKAKEYEKYKSYIDQYKKLVTDSAGQEIKVNDQVLVSEEETRRRSIEGLKQIQKLENQRFDSLKADAEAAHNATIQQKQAELEATKAQLIAQKELLTVLKQMTEALTGKTATIDTTSLDAAIAKVEATKNNLDTITATPVSVNMDSTKVDSAKQKVEQLKTLTLNGTTIEVNADTTPADFGIKKLITGSNGEEITMDVNPEYEKAEKELDAFRNGESVDDVTVGVDADTSKAEVKLESIKRPTDSEHTVKPNANAVIKTINQLKQPTSSTHTIYQKIVPTRAQGGPVPQKLATGGRFTGSGRVPGYDPTDSDKVNALLTGGEFVIKRKAVDAIGLPILHKLNNIVSSKNIPLMKMPKLPRFASGGFVGSSQLSGASTSPGLGDLGTITLQTGGQSHQVLAPREVAEALQTFINSDGGL